MSITNEHDSGAIQGQKAGLSNPIIVVDDDLDDHYIVKTAFETIGLGPLVRFFTDARDVLEYLHESPERPFVILCDINLPRLSGFQLREALVSDTFLKRKSIPFVFYSTAANPEQVDKAFELTVQGFFRKGFSMAEVERRIRVIVDYWSQSERPDC